MGWARSRWWFFVPGLVCVTLCLLMLRGGGALYWGPHESDLTNQFYPWQVFIHRWVMRGVIPFWDPHVFSGYPTLETQQMLALNPVHLLSLLLPPELGLIAMMAGNAVIGCVAMCWALWRWGRLTALASAMGGVLYICGALFALRVMAGHFTVVAALAWWPLALLSIIQIARMGTRPVEACDARWHSRLWRDLKRVKRSTWRLAVASAIFHAMVILAGGPQYIVYLFYMEAAALAVMVRFHRWPMMIALAGTIWVQALLISAPQWLPATWYLPFTGRAIHGGGLGKMSFEPFLNFWLEFIMPFPFGNDLTRTHLHFKNVWETGTYPGGATLVLALAVLIRVAMYWIRRLVSRQQRFSRVQRPVVYAGAAMAFLGFYMMCGGWLPGFGGFREPMKARAVLAIALAVLAAAGLDGLVRNPRQWRWPVFAGVVISLASLGFALTFSNIDSFRDLIRSFGMPIEPLVMDEYENTLANPATAISAYHSAIIWSSLGAITAGLAVLLPGRRVWLGIVVLSGVTVGDLLFAHSGAWMGRHRYEDHGLPAPVVQYFEPRLKQSASSGELPWRVTIHPAIINRTHHMDGLYEAYGYDPLMPAFSVGRLMIKGVREISNPEDPRWRIPLLDRTGVRYDASRWLPPDSGNPALADLYTTSAQANVIQALDANLFDVSRNVIADSPGEGVFGPDLLGTHYVLPAGFKGSLLTQKEVPADFQREIAEVFPARDFVTTSPSTLLEGESIEPLWEVAADKNAYGALTVTSTRPDEWGVAVNLREQALVIFKSTWLPGWYVSIDGKDAGTALFANNWMCAAVVPAGEHDVVFRYRPVGWQTSWVLFAMGVVFCAIMSTWNFRSAKSR